MNIKDMKELDPFQTQVILVLDRIARSLERFLEEDDEFRKTS